MAHRSIRPRLASPLGAQFGHKRGEATPQEHRVALQDLYEMLQVNYKVNRRRSLGTIRYPFKHLLDHFGERTKAIRITTDRLERYVHARQLDGAAADFGHRERPDRFIVNTWIGSS